MVFNDLSFIAFFIITLSIFWFLNVRNIKFRNLFLLFASYFFYTTWDYRFSLLILTSTCIDFFLGRAIHKASTKKLKTVIISITLFLNLALLSLFKYYNFFVESGAQLLDLMGFNINITTLNIIFPVGISFYTFQSMSYSIEIYKNKIKPTNDFINFANFVVFFPQLLCGPIERAKTFLPQFSTVKKWELKTNNLAIKRITWGLFMKLVVADNLRPVIQNVFNSPQDYNSISQIIASVFYSIQIYCDFAGYSLIVIGLAALLGFELSQNFNYPLFAKNISEFWRSWHMTLTGWFIQYLFRPLMFKFASISSNLTRDFISIFITFFVIGLWHGASYNFIIWGILNGVLYFIESNRKIVFFKSQNNFSKAISILCTLLLLSQVNVFFGISTAEETIFYFSQMFNLTSGGEFIFDFNEIDSLLILIYLGILIITEFFNRPNFSPIDNLKLNTPLRFLFYFILLLLIADNFVHTEEFIYTEF